MQLESIPQQPEANGERWLSPRFRHRHGGRPSLSLSLVLIVALGAALATSRSAVAAGTIYLTSCLPDGCVYDPTVPGHPDDSRTNQSSLLANTANIQPFAAGQVAWAEVMACVQREFAPYDVVVTDVDPGTATHFEVVVAGTPDEAGQGSDVDGVAPFTCAVIPNGIAFDFANSDQNVHDICVTAAHEAAHLLGADHEVLERDNMTYLTGCMDKLFAPAAAPCGETDPRDCLCGGTTQDSDQVVAAALGRAGAGSLLFGDEFSAFDVVTDPANPAEEPSACHWDAIVGAAPSAVAARPRVRALRCATMERLGVRAPIAPSP